MSAWSKRIAVLVSVSALAVASCGDDTAESNPPETSAADAPESSSPVTSTATEDISTTPAPETTFDPSWAFQHDLQGRTFVAQSSTAFDLAGQEVRIAFVDGQVRASGGCNSMIAPVVSDDGMLWIEPLATTEIGCDPPLMELDGALGEFLLAHPRYAIDGDQLTLTTDGGNIVLIDRRVVSPDLPLEGTIWDVVALGDDMSMGTIPVGVEASLTIVDGQAQVKTGCNSGGASAEITESAPSAGTITFGPLALTRMMCDAAAMEVEATISSILTGEVSYTIVEQQLSLINVASSQRLDASGS